MIESRDQRTLARVAFKMILKFRKARLRRLLQIGATRSNLGGQAWVFGALFGLN